MHMIPMSSQWARFTSKKEKVDSKPWRYLNDILSRNPEGSLERYFVAIKELEERDRNCYSEVIISLDSKSFVEMLVLDACLFIELFCKHWDKEQSVFMLTLDWLKLLVNLDLIMLENQIPFFILQCLFELISPTHVSGSSPSLVEMALNIFGTHYLSLSERVNQYSNNEIQQLLHLLHTTYILIPEEHSGSDTWPKRIPCASELEERGVKSRKREDARATDSLDIKFRNGVIEIPDFEATEGQIVEICNLIALEPCYPHIKRHTTSYIYFMNCLIKSDKDVKILRQQGIIENLIGSDGDVAALFNNIGREVIICGQHFYQSNVSDEIKQYCERTPPKLRAALVHDYFKNPWEIISFLAALLLTMTQTFFSLFPTFAHEK